MKAAKFHSCVVGHLIDCKLTVIERDCALLLRRHMALRSLARSSRRYNAAMLVHGHQDDKNQNLFLSSAGPNHFFLCALS